MRSVLLLSFLAVLVLVAVEVRSDDCPKACTLEYTPICASNGKDTRQFSNPCDLDAYNCLNKENFVSTGKQLCEGGDN